MDSDEKETGVEVIRVDEVQDPEVPARPTRRRFSAKYKLAILREADAGTGRISGSDRGEARGVLEQGSQEPPCLHRFLGGTGIPETLATLANIRHLSSKGILCRTTGERRR